MKQLSFEDIRKYKIILEHRGETWTIENLTEEQLNQHVKCLQNRLWTGWGYKVERQAF